MKTRIQIKKSTYQLCYDQIKVLLDKHDDDLYTRLSMIAIVVGCPVVIVYHFAAEILKNDEILNKVKSIEDFYGVEVV